MATREDELNLTRVSAGTTTYAANNAAWLLTHRASYIVENILDLLTSSLLCFLVMCIPVIVSLPGQKL